MFKFKNNNKQLLLILIITFIISEIIDDFLDHLLGQSILHSLLQVFLFFMFFLVIIKATLERERNKINELIPNELMNILRIIDSEKKKGILINQAKLMKLLNVTKPTIKKRLDQLINLNYIYFEKEGNKKYIKLTELGNSIV